jgi:hypothetical protein
MRAVMFEQLLFPQLVVTFALGWTSEFSHRAIPLSPPVMPMKWAECAPGFAKQR